MPPELWLLVLARDPARAKSRLAGVLGPASRAALALAMLEDVLESARHARVGPVLVVTDSATVRTVAARHGVAALRVRPRGTRSAARDALAAATRRGARHVAILPADLPLLRPADIVAVAARARTADVVLAPDRRREGTNALVLSSLGLTLAPRFGPSSFRRHLEAARLAGLRSRTVLRRGFALDLDGPDDLRALLASRARPGRHTADVLKRLGLSSGPGDPRRQRAAPASARLRAR